MDEKCRICLQRGSFVCIFGVKGSLKLSSKIMSIANVKISPNDGLPSTICKTCTEKLDKCIEFIELCEKSDYILRSNINCFEKSEILLEEHDYNTETNIDDSINNSELENDYICKNLNFSAQERPIDGINKEKDINLECSSDIPKNENRESRKQQCFKCGKISFENTLKDAHWRATVFLSSLQQKLFISTKFEGPPQDTYGGKTLQLYNMRRSIRTFCRPCSA